MPGRDSLAQVMVGLKAQGMTLEQIAEKTSLPLEVCQRRMNSHLEQTASSMSSAQMRMLQLERLEEILPVLYEHAKSGDIATQGKNIKNLIELIREITELMDLRKDRLRDEQVRLTQAQTQMVLAAVDSVRLGMLEKVISLVGEDYREQLATIWHSSFSDLAAVALEQQSQAVVEMGDGAGPVELKPVPAQG